MPFPDLRTLLSVLIFLPSIFVAAGSWAEDRPAFELYSWKAGNAWAYSILEGTTSVKSSEAIRSSKHRLKNITYLKGRIATLPPKCDLFWRVKDRSEFTLPRKEVVYEVSNYSDGAEIELILPNDRRASREATLGR